MITETAAAIQSGREEEELMLRKTVTATLTAACVFAFCPQAMASAAPLPVVAGDAPPVRSKVTDGTALRRATTDPATAAARRAARQAFVIDQMRAGRLVDTASIQSTVVDGVQTVWEEGVTINSIKVSSVSSDLAVDGGVVAESLGVNAVSDGISRSDGAATSLGLQGTLAIGGASFLSGYCTTTTSTKGNKLTGCFQKYKLSTSTATRDFFYYNRWGTAEGKSITAGIDYYATKIDLRSRPWSGQSGQVAALVDYWPKAGVKSCDDHSIEVSKGSFTGKLPIQDCNNVTPSPSATEKSMRVVYDQGAVSTGRVHGTDMALIYSTFKGKSPSYADYSYAKFCKGTLITCDAVLRTDSGW